MSSTRTPRTSQRIAIERHRRGNRWMHWINFPLLTVMIWSGLRIYWADLRDPFVFGIGGWEIYEFFPSTVNESLGLNRKLAWGMAFHFTFAWFFVLNGMAFAGYLWRTKGWRNFLPTGDDLRAIPAVLLHEVGIRKEAPPQGKYNGMQQLSYAGVLGMGLLAIITGFAIYKPTQLAPLTWLLGGYEGARFLHFSVTIGFLAFFVIHLVQVGRSGLANVFSMVTGYELLPLDEMPRESTVERRLSGRLRDLITVLLVPTVLVLAWAKFDDALNPGWPRAIAVGVVALGFVWDWVWTAYRGATPGKVVNGLQVVQVGTNTSPTVLQSLVRAGGWVPLMVVVAGIGSLSRFAVVLLVLAAVISVALLVKGPKRRTVMDLVAGTEVIAAAPSPDGTNHVAATIAVEARA